MKRLTISADACTETLALLIAMAWADGRLDDKEKEGVRAASEVFNLTNTPSFNLPGSLDFRDARNFASISSMRNNPRQFQLGAKIYW